MKNKGSVRVYQLTFIFEKKSRLKGDELESKRKRNSMQTIDKFIKVELNLKFSK